MRQSCYVLRVVRISTSAKAKQQAVQTWHRSKKAQLVRQLAWSELNQTQQQQQQDWKCPVICAAGAAAGACATAGGEATAVPAVAAYLRSMEGEQRGKRCSTGEKVRSTGGEPCRTGKMPQKQEIRLATLA